MRETCALPTFWGDAWAAGWVGSGVGLGGAVIPVYRNMCVKFAADAKKCSEKLIYSQQQQQKLCALLIKKRKIK